MRAFKENVCNDNCCKCVLNLVQVLTGAVPRELNEIEALFESCKSYFGLRCSSRKTVQVVIDLSLIFLAA